MAVTLLIGGARSGKSTLALALAGGTGRPVTFIATAPLHVGMDERIERHRAERPAGWTTVEAPTDLVGALAALDPGATAIVDCLTLWVSNLMEAGWDDAAIGSAARSLASATGGRTGATIVVTNEVGAGVHPPTELGIRFQDLLGRVNTIVAADAERVLLCVAGRALPLETAEQVIG